MVDIAEITAIITGFSIVAFIIWNSSKKAASMEIKLNQIDKKQDKEITEIRREHNDDVVELRKEMSNQDNEAIKQIGIARVERKEEITKAIINQHERLEVLQRQIDQLKSDIKDLSTRITVSGTKSDVFEREVERLCEESAEAKKFFADWNQRIEDRIENSKKELMGMMNMLINISDANRYTKKNEPTN